MGAACAAALAAASCSSGNGGSDSNGNVTPPAGGSPVEVICDAIGVSHVRADSDAGAFFGSGWAAARDRFFQMSYRRLRAEGRLAEFFGPGPNVEYVQSDRRARLLGFTRYAARAETLMQPATRALLQAYADGVNAYLDAPTEPLHPLFAQLGVTVEDWTVRDTIALWTCFGQQRSVEPTFEAQGLVDFENLVAQIGFDAAVEESTDDLIFDEEAAIVQQSDVPPGVQQQMFDYAESLGLASVADPNAAQQGYYTHESQTFSNVWAIGGARSTTGGGLLVSDPRLQVELPSDFYEWHMRGATFSVRGVGVAGAPYILLGATPDVAWGATSIGMDQADLFRIRIAAGGGGYVLDGSVVPWDVEQTETVLVKGGSSFDVTYRECHWGPVVTPIVSVIGAAPNDGWAWKAIPWVEPERDTAHAFPGLYRASDVAELDAAFEALRFPALNYVFADSGGGIGYRAKGPAIVRSLASPLGGQIAQDGTVTETDWLDVVPHDVMPAVIDPTGDVVFSANHAPVGSWYPIPLGIGSMGTGDTGRARRIRELFSEQQTFSQADSEAIHFDCVDVTGRDMTRIGLHLRDVQGATLGADTLSALAEVDGWYQAGAEMTVDHHGSLLVSNFPYDFRKDVPEAAPLVAVYGGGRSGLHLFLKTMAEKLDADPLGTIVTPEEQTYVEFELSSAWNVTIASAGPPQSWTSHFADEVATVTKLPWDEDGEFPTLDASGAVTVGPLPCPLPGTLLSQHSQAFTLSAALGHPDATRALLPLGNAEQPGPHHLDQQPIYEAAELRGAPFTPSAVEALGPTEVVTLSYDG